MGRQEAELKFSRIGKESPAKEGNSPVGEKQSEDSRYQSTAGHGKSGGKQGGPPSKAKYDLVTDSEQVP